MKTHSKSPLRRGLSIATVFLFLFTQILPANSAASWTPGELKDPSQLAPSKSVSADAQAQEVRAQKPQTSQQFLQQGFQLDPVKDQDRLAKSDQTRNQSRDSAEYDFEDALAQLSPDYASAVIVKNLSADDVKKLAQLSIEVGIAVVGGKIVLFTTGREDEIRLNPAAVQLLKKASLIAHTHPQTRAAQPSIEDIDAAGSQVEYVIGTDEVWAYNSDGLASETALSFDELSSQIESAQNRNSYLNERQVRAQLNKFIRLVDEYNQNPQTAELFRSGTPTVMPGEPRLGAFQANGGTATLTQSSRSLFRMDYSMPTVSSFGGVYMIFGTPQNMSANSTFTFGLRTNNPCTGTCLKVEFKDADGRVASVYLTGLSTTETNKDIAKASLLASNPQLDFTRIKEIVFVMDRAMANGQVSGFVEVRTGGGLYYEAVVNPAAYNATTHTSLLNKPVVSGTGANVNPANPKGLILVNQTSADAFDMLYDVTPDTAAFVFSQVGWGYFDAGNNFVGTPMNLPENFVLGVNGPAGSQVKVEVVDTGKRTAIFLLNLNGSLGNYTLSLSGDNIPAGFDRTKIAFVNFVMDQNLAKFSPVGTIQVRTKGLSFVPVVDGIVYNPSTHTVLPSSPVLGATGANVNPANPKGLILQTQISDKNFEFLYDLTPHQDAFVFSQTSWGYFDAGNQFVGTAGALPATFILAANGPAGSQLMVEIVDTTGKIAKFKLNLTGAYQNYSLALSGNNIPAGFNINSIAFVNYVLDQNLAKYTLAGKIQIQTAGLSYIPVVDGTAHNTSAHSWLPNKPVLSATGANVTPTDPKGLILMSQSSDRDFEFLYDLTPDTDAFVFSQIGWGYFDAGNQFVGTAGTLPSGFVLGANGPAGSQLMVEIVDTTGKIAKFKLNLTGAFQNYTLNLTGSNVPAGFNRSSIAFVNYVLDQNLAKYTLAGKIQIQNYGISYIPVVTGTAYTPAAVTVLTNKPVLSATGANVTPTDPKGLIVMNQTSASDFDFLYDLTPDTDSFVFTQVGWGYFDAGNQFVGTAGALPMNFVVAANGPAGSQLMVEIVDTTGKIAKFKLNLTGAFQNYAINLTAGNIPTGFNINSIAFVNYVLDQNLARYTLAGQIQIKTGGLSYIPVVNGTALNVPAISPLPSSPVVSATGANVVPTDPKGLIVMNQTSGSDFGFLYDLTPDTDAFVFSQIGWGYFDAGNQFVGTAGSLPATFVLAANGPAGSQMMVEIVDTTGKIAKFKLNLTGTFQNYALALSGSNVPVGFNIASIAFVNFVLDQGLARYTLAGQVQIKTSGLAYTPVITGTAYDAAAHTVLPDQPVISATGSNVNPADPHGLIVQTQQSASAYEFLYDVTPDNDAFVFSQIGWGYFDTDGRFVGIGANLSGAPLVLGLNGPAGSSVIVEVVDTNQRVAKFKLQLSGDFRNYTLDLSGGNIPPFFHPESIAMINIVVDPASAGYNPAGKIQVRTKNLFYA